MEIVSEKPEEQLKKLRINEGVNLFIEDSRVKFPADQDHTINSTDTDCLTKWEREFDLD